MNGKNNNCIIYKILSIILISIIIFFTFVSNVSAYTYSENELYEKMILDARSRFLWSQSGFVLLKNSNDTYSIFAYDYTKCSFSFNDNNDLIVTFTRYYKNICI